MILRLAVSGAAHLAAGALIGALAVLAWKAVRQAEGTRSDHSPGSAAPPPPAEASSEPPPA
ncbi:MAG: hypothetical protein NZ523_08580 [Elioraea sp.]|nr:hypothetical protein [Elioraea sp.]